MSAQVLWRVWSYDEANKGWVAVDQGGQADMRAGADRRNSAARRHDSAGSYVALPDGQVPDASLSARARETHLRLYLDGEHANAAHCGSSYGTVTDDPDAVTCQNATCLNAVTDARKRGAGTAREALLAALDASDRLAADADTVDPSPWRRSGAATSTRVRDATGAMVVRDGTDAAHAHIAANDPATVRARNAAVRALLAAHDACPPACGTTNLLADAYAPGWRDTRP